MLLDYQDLDDDTRDKMVSEIQADIDGGTLYMSKRLSQGGRDDYPDLLENAAENHDDEWLSNEIAKAQRLNPTVPRENQNGTVTQTKMPSNAHTMLGMGEFNTFYIRALCLRAIEEKRELVIYRARQSSRPRPESEAAIGKKPDPEWLLKELRLHPEQRDPDVIPEPNSGLTVRLG